MRTWTAIIITGLLLGSCAQKLGKPDMRWETLFDGQTLEGWNLINGDLPFTVENGEIRGVTAEGVKTRYLATDKQYGDFILELEMNNSEGENSGIQFRSIQAPQFKAGLTGYQMEVDPSPRAWTGGIFFEGMGQWRHPPIDNRRCLKAWNNQDWNRLRIEAKGNRLRTFVNDQPCAYLYDDTLETGYIALQIHSVNQFMGRANATTRWKNIRINENPYENEYTPDDVNLRSISYLSDKLSPHEKGNGWQRLTAETSGELNWNIVEIKNSVTNASKEVLTTSIKAKQKQSFKSISLPIDYSAYELIADVKMSSGTKGTIHYPVIKPMKDAQGVNCTSSYAIFDDSSLTDKKSDFDYTMGSVAGIVGAKNLSELNRRKRILPPEKWQRIKILVQGTQVEHWLNSVKVAKYDKCNLQSEELDKASKIQIIVETGRLDLRTIKYRPL